MDVVCLITARGGSKGIPRKNVRALAGKPLIAWTIEAAHASTSVNRVIVSTDNQEIAMISRAWGAEVPFMRPAELAQDDSPHIDTVMHAVRWLADVDGRRPDYLMLLQPTSPLRSSTDVEAAIEIATSRQVPAVVSVCEMHPHPYLAKMIDERGCLRNVLSSGIDYLCRQNLPPAYALNGAIYLQEFSFWLERQETAPDNAVPYIMPTSRSLDVDDEWGFYLANLLLGASHVSAAA